MAKHYNHLVKNAGYSVVTTMTSTSNAFLNQHLKTVKNTLKNIIFQRVREQSILSKLNKAISDYISEFLR
ncbi:hypothetical protein F0L19_20895 [Escherichia coli O157]|nr:hypothetical protein F0L19_20895 [Escherichia coli O157]